jgi:MFS transporter, DHA2 family, multidrug resistance protein
MNPWKTLVVLSLSLVIIGLDTPSSLQWMVDSYLLVLAGLLLVFGTLGDRYGRKLALQTAVTLFGLASVAAVGIGLGPLAGGLLPSPRMAAALEPAG